MRPDISVYYGNNHSLLRDLSSCTPNTQCDNRRVNVYVLGFTIEIDNLQTTNITNHEHGLYGGRSPDYKTLNISNFIVKIIRRVV